MTMRSQLVSVLLALATLGCSASAQTSEQVELSARLMRREVQRGRSQFPDASSSKWRLKFHPEWPLVGTSIREKKSVTSSPAK